MRGAKAILNHVQLMRAIQAEQRAGNGHQFPQLVARNGNLVPATLNLAGTTAHQPHWYNTNGFREPEFWVPPEDHGGERDVARKSASTNVGSLVAADREVEHESNYEKRVAFVLQARPGFIALRSQFPCATYLSSEGKKLKHYFDYWVQYESGVRKAVAVKPEQRREETEAILEQIRATGSPDFDEVELITEKTATIAAFQNAKELLLSRENHDQVEVDRLITDLRAGPVKVTLLRMLYSDVPLNRRRTAIWRLIDLQVLTQIGSDRVSYDTTFSVNL